MRRNRRPAGKVGLLLISLGIIVLLSLVLPTGFWWFVLGVVLIVLGFCWMKRC